MRRLSRGLATLILLAPGPVALAQAKAPAPDQETGVARPRTTPETSEKAVEEVTITGPGASGPAAIDKRSFDLTGDLRATTGSLADALRNIPSLEIDPQGGLSLRGDPNVTILVDGKASAMFNGPGRADALQQLPADKVARVEVITTPSAAMTAQGSGGVINIVLKQARGAGASGSIYGVYGSQSAGRTGATFGYNAKDLNLSGYAVGNYVRSKSTVWFDRVQRPDVGPATFLQDKLTVRNIGRYNVAQASAAYDLDAKTRVAGSAQYSRFGLHGDPLQVSMASDDTGRLDVVNHVGSRTLINNSLGLTASVARSFAEEGHQLSFDVSRSRDAPREHIVFFDTPALPPGPLSVRDLRNASTLTISDIKIAYVMPFGSAAKLSTGYQLRLDDNVFDNSFVTSLGPASAGGATASASHFELEQAVHSVYGTYERSFGALSLQAGLRIEDTQVDAGPDTVARGPRDDVRPYGSLHLAYKFDDARQLLASYSQRVTRPTPAQLNPFPVLTSSSDFQQGNPDLEPQLTDAYELSFRRRRGPSNVAATLYYRRSRDEIAPVYRANGDGVFLTTYENLSDSRNIGIEVSVSRRIGKTITYAVNANAYASQVDLQAANGSSRSASGLGGRANVDWRPTEDDVFQLNAIFTGKRLLPQGFSKPTWYLNLGWRHKFHDRLSFVVTAQDVLGTNRYRQVLDTPTLQFAREDRTVYRSVLLRLDYRFGAAARPREAEFEYN